MKFKIRIIFSILCGVSLAIAMDNGVRIVDTKSFDEMLKIGTEEGFGKWVKDNVVDLNTRCIKIENYMIAGKTKFMYPIERVITRYGRNFQSLIKLLTILIGQGVSINGYEDFNPLAYAIGAKYGKDIVIGVYNLGADPQKKFDRDNAMITAQEWAYGLLQEEKSKDRAPDHQRIRDLTELLELFKSERPQINNPIHSSSGIASSTPTKQNVAVAQPTVTKTTQQLNNNAAAQNNQVVNDQPVKPMLFTARQVAGVAVVSMLCGIGLKMAYDWYFGQQEHDDVAGEVAENSVEVVK